MASEIQAVFGSGAALYFTVRNPVGQIWNTNSSAFESFNPANILQYAISMTEQSGSGIYTGTFPTLITAGVYNIVSYQQVGVAVVITDPPVAVGTFQWSGSVEVALSSLASSGQISQMSPIKMAKGVMVTNFPIYFVSAADGISPLTSGVVSGSVSRDGGAWGVLQSGAYSEIGRGLFNLQALTSGDMNGGTVSLQFTANGVSGGQAIPRVFTIVTQKVSGSV